MAPDTSSRPINSFMIASLPPDGILCLKVSLDEINLLYGENSLTTKIGFWVGTGVIERTSPCTPYGPCRL